MVLHSLKLVLLGSILSAAASGSRIVVQGTPHQVQSFLQQPGQGDGWQNKHRCWCTVHQRADQEQHQEREIENLAAEIDRKSNTGALAREQDDDALEAKFEAQQSEERLASAEAQDQSTPTTDELVGGDPTVLAALKSVGAGQQLGDPRPSRAANCNYKLARLRDQLDEYSHVTSKLASEEADLRHQQRSSQETDVHDLSLGPTV
eukprot:TRINITY_DN7260_c0_g1_i1.p1 TRINITY_DN7260_c0_g1~~TRINITY_DN7260_c0_g1_i1.p1  ORF type:complete len:205 (-),score=49.83 TRINITY_DN7260_c0_g1_i1:324-938(-)